MHSLDILIYFLPLFPFDNDVSDNSATSSLTQLAL